MVTLSDAFFRALKRYRRVFVVVLHVALIALSNYAAFLLRFDARIPAEYWSLFVSLLPWLIVTRAICFVPFRLYEGLWRYSSIWDLRNIVVSVSSSSLAFIVLVNWPMGVRNYPVSIYFVDSLLLVCLMGGARVGRRVYRGVVRVHQSKRVLIYGAGDAGELIVRDLKNNSYYDYDPIGFVDDDASKTGTRIHGVPVLGTRRALPKILEECRPHEIFVAMPSADPSVVREIVRVLEPFKVAIKTLPNLRDVLSGRLLVSQIRDLRIDDLLTRPPVGLEALPLEKLIEGKCILVTGAGGSIGSELCRQIAQLAPNRLILYERYENSLFSVASDLATRHPGCHTEPVIGDIRDRDRLDAVMAESRPQIVFHCAAHKHVPLMESNVCEAVKNNVLGTQTLMAVSAAHGVERFVLISSDKAVNPSSVMGATKRVAELLIQAANPSGPTTFLAVRFGNVLASNGSVVPTFLDQIRSGGPVTVTHPEMRRYFMLIPEAVQLVLHAACLARAGALYVLEMGEQVSLVDMARNLIRLSGFTPDTEIPIVFTGVRPGEKLFEELISGEEYVEASGVDKIQRVLSKRSLISGDLFEKLAQLESSALAGNTTGTLFQLKEILPEFSVSGTETAIAS